ncbi:MAG: hypothetical protein V8S94_06800 [Methanobrevibacter smithii]
MGSKPEENKTNVSYASFADCNNCPWRCNLLNKLHFKVSQKEDYKKGDPLSVKGFGCYKIRKVRTSGEMSKRKLWKK